MSASLRFFRAGAGVAVLLLTSRAASAFSQTHATPNTRADTVEVTAGKQYAAGSLHRFFLGTGYRELWTTPVKVPVLDLRTFAGGLRPLRLTGGNQTKSLRLEAPDGVEYVFRLVDKSGTSTPKMLKNTFVDAIVRDQISTSHPAGAMIAARLLDAAGVLHVTPVLMVMPDDSLLGEFRKEFAGKLGMIEEYPGTPKEGPGFAGAVAIIDSDTLHALLNRDPAERIDVPAMLAARLMDMFLGDWDRHAGQWRWARRQEKPRTPWLPIPRDRDKAFISGGDGLLPGMAKVRLPMLVAFDSSYHSARGLTVNSLEFDRRLLIGLARPVWDSVTSALMKKITDSVIENAVLGAPPEYEASSRVLVARLKVRRDSLHVAADMFYRLVSVVADVHATDASDRATVTRVADGLVDVRLESGGKAYFHRQFDLRETSDIRVYLHGGSDTALVAGNVRSSIPLRVIGGNGINHLVDSSLVDGKPNRARLYGVGPVDGVEYGPDTNWNREPYVQEWGEVMPPGPTRGSAVRPAIGLRTNRELGFVPNFGIHFLKYGYGRRPYARSLGVDAEYATDVDAWRVAFTADQRYEGTPVHFLTRVRTSKLEIISFYGLGNETAGRVASTGPASKFFDVEQQQWMLYPAVALALGGRSDVSLGPVIQFSETDSTPNRYISTVEPYGFGTFGQTGMRLQLRLDGRDRVADPRRGLLLDVSGSVFPAVWDVESAFGSLRAAGRAYLTLPIPVVHPILEFRAGGAKVFGEFPFHEAAFIGGPGSLRSLDAQRYAGDASVYGSVELRVPLGNFTVILPWNVGVFGVMDAGRVFVDGESPGGWHSARGIGFWVGVFGPTTAIRFCRRPGDTGPC